MKIDTEDTIVAISTPMGEGGIGIVRLSGSQAISIVRRLFIPKRKKNLSTVETFTIHYGHIYDRGKLVEEVLLSVMRAPYTYTRQDVVEISCHGGIVPLRKVLELCLMEGARLAEPGEFTLRAFLNGRIDLVQAEAVCDIIRARTDAGLNCALHQLEGHLSTSVNRIREGIVDLLAHIEACLDYSEEDIPQLCRAEIVERMERISSGIRELLKSVQSGRILREGLKTAIVGKPNVGKSSLLNALLEEEKAIVSPIPGTTRDVVEDMVNLLGIPMKIMDTAGIRHARDEIEMAGIERTRRSIALADLVLFVIELSIPLSEEDRHIAENLMGRKTILVANKCDLPQVVSEREIRELWTSCLTRLEPERESLSVNSINPRYDGSGNPSVLRNPPLIKVSATKRIMIKELQELIYSLFIKGEVSISDAVLVTNVRHHDALVKAEESLKEGIETCNRGESEEFIALDLRRALEALGEIVGETATEDILDRIFSKFCIGK
ncbi:tRNA uridine-5-carboxymethylaminomethyl(34) synthesis GTPase MnmE [bacterium]|nr:tRNA uridine-5-carboxymethylaminomethyl(34) synthesis GTPase MnmE [bacterium]